MTQVTPGFEERQSIVVRFAGDSGDGMQTVGERFTDSSVMVPNAIATFPDFVMAWLKIPYLVASFFGGTGILIIVGVMLDTIKQIESYLLMHHYEGFIKAGRIRGRR